MIKCNVFMWKNLKKKNVKESISSAWVDGILKDLSVSCFGDV